VDSRTLQVDWGIPGGAELHSLGIFYRVRVAGGELRHEVGGSTDLAAWIPVTQVSDLQRAVIVDIALALDRTRPPSGHVEPISVSGLLRH
jgi:hypothetical protein